MVHVHIVFLGSEGKLTVAAQRIDMLTGVGNLSYNTVSGTNSVQSLSGTVAEHFIPLLQQEGRIVLLRHQILFSLSFHVLFEAR